MQVHAPSLFSFLTFQGIPTWVARYAMDHGCHRIDWPVKASNDRGIAFYEGLGAERVADRLSYRLSEPRIGGLAQEARLLLADDPVRQPPNP